MMKRIFSKHLLSLLALGFFVLLAVGSDEEEEKKNNDGTPKTERQLEVEKHFSSWDGSHNGLTKVIKNAMNDPASYEHVETTFWDMKDHLVVMTTYGGKNAFGGVVKNFVKAKVELNGNVLEIIEEGQ